MKRISSLIAVRHCLFAALITAASVRQAQAQRLQRETIAPTGNHGTQQGTLIRETTGQPYQTRTRSDGEVSFRPGFQQPVFSIQTLSNPISVKIIPNPALLAFRIEGEIPGTSALIEMHDEAGRLIRSAQIRSGSTEFDCSHWANGLYHITITSDKKNLMTAKLIKHQ